MDRRARRVQSQSPALAADDGEKYMQEKGIASLIRSGCDLEVSELDKSGIVQSRWLHSTADGIAPLQRRSGQSSLARSADRWTRVLSDAFLPVGFPHSVSDDYLAYQAYDSLQAFFSTITSLLASRALLQGLGVGNADSSATFALLLTVIKDATSRTATILFAHRFGLRIEPDAKRYRFLADVFNDAAFFLELSSPHLGSWGKVVALGTGEALRALCGVAAGASKAALSVHFAKQDNLSELNAKEASQETAVGLIGLLAGTAIVKLVEDQSTVLVLMVLLVLAHLWTNYLGVRSVCLATVNRQRATILFDELARSGTILTPKEVASREQILFWKPVAVNRNGKPVTRVHFATSYTDAAGFQGNDNGARAYDGPMHTSFIRPYSPGRLGCIRLFLWHGAEARHAVLAWFMALETAWTTDRGAPYGMAQMPSSSAMVGNNGDHPQVPASAPPSIVKGDQIWSRLTDRGWDLETQAMETEAPVRFRFSPTSRNRKTK